MSKKLPFMKFYPADWMADAGLRKCPILARLVWFEMLCLMWNCDSRGVLRTNGVPWTNEDIANGILGPNEDIIEGIELLGRNGVFSRMRSDWAVYSRRMFRDAKLSETRASAGALGGYATSKSKKKGHQKSSKTLTSDFCILIKKRKKEWLLTEHPELLYQAYPRHVGKAAAIQAIAHALAKLYTDGDGHHESWLLGRVQMYANSPDGQAGKFTPYPATWFNGERYKDDESEWQGRGPSGEGTDCQQKATEAHWWNDQGFSHPTPQLMALKGVVAGITLMDAIKKHKGDAAAVVAAVNGATG